MRICRASLVALAGCGRIGFGELADSGAGSSGADAMLPPVMRAGLSSSASGPTIGNVTVGVPDTALPGDLLLLGIYCSSTSTLTAAAGWTTRLDINDTIDQFHAAFFYRVIAVGDPPGYSFPTSSMSTAWALAAYRGVAADAFDVDYAMEQTGSASGGTSVTFTIPSQQMTSTGDELVLVVLSDAGFGTATWSAPPAMSPLVTNIKIGMFDGAADAAGPTGDLPVTVTPSNANGSRAGVWFVALRR